MFLDQAQEIPNGPTEAFAWEPDLLVWIEANFRSMATYIAQPCLEKMYT